MMSSDVDRLRNCVREINNTWTIPLRFGIALYLVVEILGAVPASAGLVVMVLLVPVTRKFLRYSKAYQKTILQHTDERVRQTQEVMSGIRIIKLMAWERSFVEKIGGVREKELKALRKAAILKSLCESSPAALPLRLVDHALLSRRLHRRHGSPGHHCHRDPWNVHDRDGQHTDGIDGLPGALAA